MHSAQVLTTGTATTGYHAHHHSRDRHDPVDLGGGADRATGYEIFKYTDCKVNTLHLEADANGYLMGTVGMIGLDAGDHDGDGHSVSPAS